MTTPLRPRAGRPRCGPSRPVRPPSERTAAPRSRIRRGRPFGLEHPPRRAAKRARAARRWRRARCPAVALRSRAWPPASSPAPSRTRRRPAEARRRSSAAPRAPAPPAPSPRAVPRSSPTPPRQPMRTRQSPLPPPPSARIERTDGAQQPVRRRVELRGKRGDLVRERVEVRGLERRDGAGECLQVHGIPHESKDTIHTYSIVVKPSEPGYVDPGVLTPALVRGEGGFSVADGRPRGIGRTRVFARGAHRARLGVGRRGFTRARRDEDQGGPVSPAGGPAGRGPDGTEDVKSAHISHPMRWLLSCAPRVWPAGRGPFVAAFGAGPRSAERLSKCMIGALASARRGRDDLVRLRRAESTARGWLGLSLARGGCCRVRVRSQPTWRRADSSLVYRRRRQRWGWLRRLSRPGLLGLPGLRWRW